MSHKPKYAISTSAMLAGISKLSLARGDVIVIKDYDTLDYLSKVQLPLGFTVPLIFSPGGIQKLNRQDLLNLLEQLEQQTVQPEFAESASAPL